jgi:ABC-type histidine transport system ATPase subunit
MKFSQLRAIVAVAVADRGNFSEEQGPAYELLTNPQSDRLRIFLSRLNVR